MADEVPEFAEVGDPMEGYKPTDMFDTKDMAITAAVGLLAGGLTYALWGSAPSKDKRTKRRHNTKKWLSSVGIGTGAALLAAAGCYGYHMYNGSNFSHTYNTKFDKPPKAVHYYVAGAGAFDKPDAAGYIGHVNTIAGKNRSVLVNMNDTDYALQHMIAIHKAYPDAKIYVDSTSRGGPAMLKLLREAGEHGIEIEQAVARDPVYRFADMSKPDNVKHYYNVRPTVRHLKTYGDWNMGNIYSILGGAHGAESDYLYDRVYVPTDDYADTFDHYDAGDVNLNSNRVKRIK